MFKKILIAEDHQTTSLSIRKILEDLAVPYTDYVDDCDKALSRIQVAKKDCQPFDLLITDLSFFEDGSKPTIADGRALIRAARSAQADIKILVFSAECNPNVIRNLFNEFDIHGYVRKARQDAEELVVALKKIAEGRRYVPGYAKIATQKGPLYQFSNHDLAIIKLLSEGVRQKDIPNHLEQLKLRPWGLSSVEKKLNTMRDALGFNNNEQLIACCKDSGLL